MEILITGGCKNGKSFYAQNLIHRLAGGCKKIYLATMAPSDEEDRARVLRHQQEREGYGFITVEQPTDLADCLARLPEGSSVLLDSTTALLANEMFLPDGQVQQHAAAKVLDQIMQVARHVRHIAIVSDWIYSDAVRYDDLTEQYRKSLASIDRALAQRCSHVCEVSFSTAVYHKGEEPA